MPAIHLYEITEIILLIISPPERDPLINGVSEIRMCLSYPWSEMKDDSALTEVKDTEELGDGEIKANGNFTSIK